MKVSQASQDADFDIVEGWGQGHPTTILEKVLFFNFFPIKDWTQTENILAEKN